jgi:hypothetical protein
MAAKRRKKHKKEAGASLPKTGNSGGVDFQSLEMYFV